MIRETFSVLYQLRARKTSKITLDPEPGFRGGMPLFGSNAEVDKYFKQLKHPAPLLLFCSFSCTSPRWWGNKPPLGAAAWQRWDTFLPPPNVGAISEGFFSTAVNARSPRAHTPTCFPTAQFQLLPFQSYPLRLSPPSWFCPSIWTPSQLVCFSFLVAAYCLTLR